MTGPESDYLVAFHAQTHTYTYIHTLSGVVTQ